MKKKLFIATSLFLSFFSFTTFGQTVPGGAAEGGAEPDVHPKSQPSPVSFKRNNGNGTCGGQAQVRLSFTDKPDYLPTLQEIMCDGIIIRVDATAVDSSQWAKKGYVSYCISNTNIPPAGKISLKFNYYQSNQTFWMTENK